MFSVLPLLVHLICVGLTAYAIFFCNSRIDFLEKYPEDINFQIVDRKTYDDFVILSLSGVCVNQQIKFRYQFRKPCSFITRERHQSSIRRISID